MFAFAAAQPNAESAIAALPVVASGLAADEVDAIDKSVSRAVELHYGGRAITKKSVDERLERAGAKGMRCDRLDPTCSAQIGAVAGAGVVIVATFTTKGDADAVLALRAVDVVEAAQLAHASRNVSAALTVDVVRDVLVQLDAPAARATSVDVRGEPGARVVVDDVERGTLPLDAPLALEPGTHTIMVVSIAAQRAQPTPPFSTKIDVRRGEPVVVDAPWTAVAPPPTTSTAASDNDVAAPARPRRLENSDGTPFVAIAGGVGAALGVIAIVVGSAPLLAAYDHQETLATFEENSRADDTFLVDNAEAIALEQQAYADALDAWRSYGVAAVIVGGIVTTVGIGALAVGLALE